MYVKKKKNEVKQFVLEERTGTTPYQNKYNCGSVIFDILTPFGAPLPFCSCVPRTSFFFSAGWRSFVLRRLETSQFLVFRR